MAEGILNKIIVWILIALFLVIFIFVFYSPGEGLMAKIANLALGAQRFLPVEPQKNVVQNQQLPESAVTAQNNFIDSIKNAMSTSSDKKFCLVKFDISGLKDYDMQLVNNNGVMTSRIVKKSGDGNVFLNPTKLDNANICIFNHVKIFDCDLQSSQGCQEKNYYNDVSIITAGYGKITADVKTSSSLPVLIKIGKTNNICFVRTATVRGGEPCDRTQRIIDDQCLAYLQEKKIINPC